MRLVPLVDRDELEKLRPHKGDIVAHGEDLYTIREVGMRYYVCVPLNGSDRQDVWFKHAEVSKWLPEDDPVDPAPPPPTAKEKPPLDLLKLFPRLKALRH